MTHQPQLASPQQQQMPFEIPMLRADPGMLGNADIQTITTGENPFWLWTVSRTALRPSKAALKLNVLKREKFATLGRDDRIAASLQALNAAQPTQLSLEQWKNIVEEIGAEDWLDG